MSLLAVGLSHHSASIALLERTSLPEDAALALGRALVATDFVKEAAVLATCNRLEIYAEVTTFHGGLTAIGDQFTAATGVPLDELTPSLYAHYADEAVAHLFRVTSGLDSMAVGESQIIGQVRTALQTGQREGTVTGELGSVLQQALRVGKRVHSETGADTIGPAMVVSALRSAQEIVGPLAQSQVLVVGAGAMSGLAAATAARMGATGVQVANRTLERAQRLAAGIEGVGFSLDDEPRLTQALAQADVVLSCTGAVGQVLTQDMVRAAQADAGERPAVFIDLALPRDVDPQVANLPGCHVLSLVELREQLAGEAAGVELDAARRIVQEEVAVWRTSAQEQNVVPTVVALRSYASGVVDAELHRLLSRNPGMDPRIEAEVRQTVRRVADKLLHNPTVRVKALAAQHGDSYAEALRELFDLTVDLEAPDSVGTALRKGPGVPVGES